MSRLTREEKLRRYHAIFDQIYMNPRVHVHEISKNVKIARNTVSSYLDHMYEEEIIFGPELRLKYYPGLNKYLHLVKFDDPYAAFDELQRIPEIDYCSMFLGDWNVLFMCDGEYDPSYISGFEHEVFCGKRGDIDTPRAPLTDWKPAFRKIRSKITDFESDGRIMREFTSNGMPPWDEEEWTLFQEYEYDFRKKVTPVLRKHLISSDKFYKWIRTLPTYTTIILEFYPDGHGNYTHFGFLLKTDYPEAAISVLSNLPTSILCIRVEEGVMAYLSIKSDTSFEDLSATLRQMKISGMIERFHQAIGVFHYIGEEPEETEERYAEFE